jgi:hypothetical protein
MYRIVGDTRRSCKTSGSDGRLPFDELEDLFFHPCIRHRTWTANIPSHSLEAGVQQIEKHRNLALNVLSQA